MSSRPPTVRPHFAQLPGYAPVVPLAERARRAGLRPEACLKLDANENPYGMHPRIRAALAAALDDPQFGSIYPDPDQRALRTALADYTGLDSSMIIAGAGADELLDLVFRALLKPGGAVINCPPSFGMYPFLADINELQRTDLPRDDLFLIDQPQLIEAAGVAPTGSVIVLTSPNNPSADLVSTALLSDLLHHDIVVMLDEAYIEFAGLEASAAKMLPQHPNLIIMRTFSKWAGIAGLRLGYALAHPQLVSDLMKLKQPYNINHAAEVAGLAAIDAADEIAQQIDAIRETRDQLLQALQDINGLTPLPSQANFILTQVHESLGNGRALHDRLTSVGVFTRTYSDPTLAQYLRISMPRADQLELLIDRIREVV